MLRCWSVKVVMLFFICLWLINDWIEITCFGGVGIVGGLI